MRHLIALLALTAPALAQEPLAPKYLEETATAGLSTAYLGDWQYMVGGGAAVFDCDGDGAQDLFPVSYTHLDVYKRQFLHRTTRTRTTASSSLARTDSNCLTRRRPRLRRSWTVRLT